MKDEYLDKQRLASALHILRDPQSMKYLELCRMEGLTTAFMRLQAATSLLDGGQTEEFKKYCEEHKDDFINIPRGCKGDNCRGCKPGRRVCCAHHKVPGQVDYERIYQLRPHKRGKAKQRFPLITELEAECCNCYAINGMDQIDIAGYLTCLGYFGSITKNSVTKSIQRARKRYDIPAKRAKPKNIIPYNDVYMADERAERDSSKWGIKRKF